MNKLGAGAAAAAGVDSAAVFTAGEAAAVVNPGIDGIVGSVCDGIPAKYDNTAAGTPGN